MPDTTTTTLAPGVLPGGTRVTQRITTVKIDSWDPATRIVTFTTSKGQTYTRRIVETLDPKVLAGLKVGDQVDVTRTEATNLAVVTPAPAGQAAAPADDTLRNRLTISVLWGIDNSFSGEIAQSGSGSYQGTPINFEDTSFDSVYGKMGLLKIGFGYRTSPRSEANFNFVWSNSASEVVQIGTAGDPAEPLSVKFGDYDYWGVEGGQRFFFSRVRFTPFVGYTVGMNRFSSISADFTTPATGPQPHIAVNRPSSSRRPGPSASASRGACWSASGQSNSIANRVCGTRAASRRPPLAETGLCHNQRRQLAVVDSVPDRRALAIQDLEVGAP